MSEFDVPSPGEGAERLAARVEVVRAEALRRRMSRVDAVALGRELAAAESARRGDGPADTKRRSDRAAAYAAWEWDGKPAGGAHLDEFGVARPVTEPPANARASSFTPDFKKGK